MKKRVYLETTIVSYLAARPSRDLIIAAQQELKSLIEGARAYKSDKLRDSAGESGETLGDALLALWEKEDDFASVDHQRRGSGEAASPAAKRDVVARRRQADMAGLGGQVREQYLKATGDVKETIGEAETYANHVKERADGLARRLNNFLVQYGGQSEFLEKLRLEAIELLLAGAYEKFYVSPKKSGYREMRVNIDRNPEVLKPRKKVRDVR